MNRDSQKPYIKEFHSRRYANAFPKNIQELERDYDHIYRYHAFYLIEKNNLLGLMDLDGNEIIGPKFPKEQTNLSLLDWGDENAKMVVELNGIKNFISPNGKFYGFIPVVYDTCQRVNYGQYGQLYIVSRNGKYGILNNKGEMILQIKYEQIFPYPENVYYKHEIDTPYVIVKDVNHDFLFCPPDRRLTDYSKLKVDNIDFIKYSFNFIYNRNFTTNDLPLFIMTKNHKKCVISSAGEKLCNFIYDEIKPFFAYSKVFIITKKNNKFGILNSKGDILYKSVFDDFVGLGPGYITDKNDGQIYRCFKVIKNDKERLVKMPLDSRNRNYASPYDTPSYNGYGGSYAQDEMGYSDDDIDTIFDGDPDAYWNID